MKKILAAVMLICTAVMGIGVKAEKIEELTVTNDNSSDGIIVSGNLDSNKKNIPLVLTVKSKGKIIAAAQTSAKTTENNKTVFNFETIYFADDVESGKYEYTVSGQYIDEPYTAPMEDVPYYTSSIDSKDALTDLNEAIASKDNLRTAKVFSDYEKELGINMGDIEGLSENSKSKFYAFINESEFAFDKNDIKTVTDAKLRFKEKYNRAFSAAEYYDILSQSDLEKWLEQYGALYIADTDGIYKYYIPYKGEFYQEIATLNRNRQTEIQTLEKEQATIKRYLTEAVLLYNIYKEPGAVVRNIYDEFTDIFTPDKTYFSKLSIQRQGEVYMEMSGNRYESSDKADSDFYIKSKNKSSVSNNAGGNSGKGSAGWGTETGSSAVNVTGNKDLVNAAAFNDINTVPWAAEAIKALSAKKVILGKSNGIFAPNDKVTRAEFIKMIILAFNYDLPNQYESKFQDVNVNDWYSPYVEAARNSKLVSGDDKGNFRPSEEISREDVCVILARYLGYTGGMGINAPFTDIDDISNYALEPVVYLYKQKIVSGTDSGMFAPKVGTTRAEAAKMIYEIMIKED